jgi:hypothetical protein
MYRGFKRGYLGGLLLYPYFFVGLLEAPRLLYWTLGREFPTWLFLIVTLIFATKVLRPGADPASNGSWEIRPEMP